MKRVAIFVAALTLSACAVQADSAVAPAKMALPVCVADHQGPAAARFHFFSREEAAGDRFNGEDAKELAIHVGVLPIFGLP